MSYSFYVMTIPGLETLAFSEIRARIPGAELSKFSRGIALFRLAQVSDVLLTLRTTEDVFFSLAHIKGLRHDPEALRVLHSATLKADIAQGLSIWRHFHNGKMPQKWRVVSQKSGSHEFRRIDAGQAVVDALRKVLPRPMRHVEDDADIEFWLWLSGNEVLIGVRLSDSSMRHRQYKREHLPASLRPTVAAAMSWLARPTETDSVLDPLCGAGTILVERGLMAGYAQLLGGDISEEAVKVARLNARYAGIDASWQTWDARALPLEAHAVTRIITNLPFGKQLGTHQQNTRLYADLSKEFARVLAPDGLLVALTSDDRLLDMVLRDEGWSIVKKVVCVILGQPASIFVAERAHKDEQG